MLRVYGWVQAANRPYCKQHAKHGFQLDATPAPLLPCCQIHQKYLARGDMYWKPLVWVRSEWVLHQEVYSHYCQRILLCTLPVVQYFEGLYDVADDDGC